jgi:hypothetical protein
MSSRSELRYRLLWAEREESFDLLVRVRVGLKSRYEGPTASLRELHGLWGMDSSFSDR